MAQEKTPQTTTKTTAETTHHVRFQQRKPYVKAIKTDGAGLASQQKDRNNIVTITTYNDDTKEQRIEGVGDLIKVTPAKNASSAKTKVEVLHDKTKQDKLKAGDNISISEDSTISAVDTKYQAGEGLKLEGNVFSVIAETFSIHVSKSKLSYFGTSAKADYIIRKSALVDKDLLIDIAKDGIDFGLNTIILDYHPNIDSIVLAHKNNGTSLAGYNPVSVAEIIINQSEVGIV